MEEVNDYLSEFETSSTKLRDSLVDARSQTQSLASLDSFGGKGPDAAKSYLNDIHVNVSVAYQDVIDLFNTELKTNVEMFHAEVDSSASCIIKSEYVESFGKKIKTNKAKLKSSLKIINDSIKKINDISSASSISMTSANQAYKEISKVSEKLLTSLNSFSKMNVGSLENSINATNQAQSQMDSISGSSGGIAKYDKKDYKTFFDYLKMFSKGREGLVEAGEYAEALLTFVKNYNKVKFVKTGLFSYSLSSEDRKALAYFVSHMDDPKIKGMSAKETRQLIKKLGEQGKNFSSKFSNYNFMDMMGVLAREKFNGGDFDAKILKKLPRDAFKKVNFNIFNASTAKTVGKAAAKGFSESFDMMKPSYYKSAGKLGKGLGVLSVVSAGATGMDKYKDAKVQGLNTGESVVAAGVNTAIEIGADSAMTSALTTVGTAICPGVGTVVGFVLGVGATWAKDNIKLGDKTINEHITSGVNTAVQSVSKGAQAVGNWLFGKKKG